ncbi:MAG: hypothetical protein HYW49_06835 [Deltaproteobacteria bacterium]|nr:hypothetical protein [Deltaproteobacteria bacterium]
MLKNILTKTLLALLALAVADQTLTMAVTNRDCASLLETPTLTKAAFEKLVRAQGNIKTLQALAAKYPRETKMHLVEMGYSKGVAEKIVSAAEIVLPYILSRTVQLKAPDIFLDDHRNPQNPKWSKRVYSPNPIKIYRGVALSEGEKFSPSHFPNGYLWGAPDYDHARLYAMEWAPASIETGYVFVYELPKFMVFYKHGSGPNSGDFPEVYFLEKHVKDQKNYLEGVYELRFEITEEKIAPYVWGKTKKLKDSRFIPYDKLPENQWQMPDRFK